MFAVKAADLQVFRRYSRPVGGPQRTATNRYRAELMALPLAITSIPNSHASWTGNAHRAANDSRSPERRVEFRAEHDARLLAGGGLQD